MDKVKEFLTKPIYKAIKVWHLLLLVVIIAAASGDSSSSSSGEKKESSSSDYVKLNAKILHSRTQVTIVNEDDFDYKNLEMKLNDKYIKKIDIIRSGETLKVGFLLFADEGGNRFNLSLKPVSFSIVCDVEDDKRGLNSWEWQ